MSDEIYVRFIALEGRITAEDIERELNIEREILGHVINGEAGLASELQRSPFEPVQASWLSAEHATIWARCHLMDKLGIPRNHGTVVAQLRDHDELAEVGGEGYINDLSLQVGPVKVETAPIYDPPESSVAEPCVWVALAHALEKAIPVTQPAQAEDCRQLCDALKVAVFEYESLLAVNGYGFEKSGLSESIHKEAATRAGRLVAKIDGALTDMKWPPFHRPTAKFCSDCEEFYRAMRIMAEAAMMRPISDSQIEMAKAMHETYTHEIAKWKALGKPWSQVGHA
jgi:hypothetical protein